MVLHEATSLFFRLLLIFDQLVLLSDPRMSLVSMANSGRISKRRILSVFMHQIAAVPTPPQNREARYIRHPQVGGPGSPDQHITQFDRAGFFIECYGNSLSCAPHLIHAVQQVSQQHDDIRWQGPSLPAVHQGPCSYARCRQDGRQYLAAPTHPDIGHISTTPAAWYGAGNDASRFVDFSPLVR